MPDDRVSQGLKVTFDNHSGIADQTTIHIGFLPGPPAPGHAATPFDVTNCIDSSVINPLDGGSGSYPRSGCWYTLSKLAAGVWVRSFSGRIYVTYGQPWSVESHGYEPGQSVTDPNFFLRYDKMEMTFTGQSTDVADLTSIDYWAIPMTLRATKNGQTVQTALGLKNGATTKDLYTALSKLTTPPQSCLPAVNGPDGRAIPAVVPGEFVQYPNGPAPGSGFARIIGPSSYPAIFPLQGIPVQPYNLLKDYLEFLKQSYGPGTSLDLVPPLGNGLIATIAGEFGGVGNPPPTTGSQSKQTYALNATIDDSLNITLTGTVGSSPGLTTMVYMLSDMLNPTGIYGGNTPFYLNGSNTPTTPANDVYGWVSGDLFAGLNIGAVGSYSTVGGTIPGIKTPAQVGALTSQQWFLLPTAFQFSQMERSPHFNQWASTLADMSDAYNFAYSDRFSVVQVTLDPARMDTLQIVLEPASVD